MAFLLSFQLPLPGHHERTLHDIQDGTEHAAAAGGSQENLNHFVRKSSGLTQVAFRGIAWGPKEVINV